MDFVLILPLKSTLSFTHSHGTHNFLLFSSLCVGHLSTSLAIILQFCSLSFSYSFSPSLFGSFTHYNILLITLQLRLLLLLFLWVFLLNFPRLRFLLTFFFTFCFYTHSGNLVIQFMLLIRTGFCELLSSLLENILSHALISGTLLLLHSS